MHLHNHFRGMKTLLLRMGLGFLHWTIHAFFLLCNRKNYWCDDIRGSSYIFKLVLLCFPCYLKRSSSYKLICGLLFIRFGIVMSDSIVSKILLVIQFHTSILIHILLHMKNLVVHGWLKLCIDIMHMMVPLPSCLWRTLYAIWHRQ